VRIFARVTGDGGAMTCSPLAPTSSFPTRARRRPRDTERRRAGARIGVRITKVATVKIGPTATFDAPLALTRGRHAGYVLWNWRKQEPSESLQTRRRRHADEEDPRPFVDTIDARASRAARRGTGPAAADWSRSMSREIIAVTPNPPGRALHGSVAPGANPSEQVTIDPGDDKDHHLTVVMPASYVRTM
jgi:hypothetical protein